MKRRLCLCILMTGLIFATLAARADQPPELLLAPPRSETHFVNFERQIAENLNKSDEFRFIKDWAQERGIRAYLFGGAATAFAAYTRWQQEYKAGSRRFSGDRFNFKLTNIFHFNQDIDIMLDAGLTEAQDLQRALDLQFPYQKTTGGKTVSVWEVRPLRYRIGLRAEIIDNKDFENQNTDSNSTGLIEISASPRERSRFQDVRSFRKTEGRFLDDIANGQITYYETGLHDTTSRATAANPPIISALRFLIKLYEYNLTTDKESMARVQRIIDSTDFLKVRDERGSRRWIEKNASKLLDNAVDVEAAWTMLHKTGLLRKLSIFGDRRDPDSVAWTMAQRPLPSSPILPTPNSATAGQLGVTKLYMKVLDFKTYERLRMGTVSKPNLLLPEQKIFRGRPGVILAMNPRPKPGEIWIEFNVNPMGVSGQDFDTPDPGIVRVFNRNLLELNPKSLKIKRSDLEDLMMRKTDPEFIVYLIREYNLSSTLHRDEYQAIENLLKDESMQARYGTVLAPILLNYEQREAFASPSRFIKTIQQLLQQGQLNKPQIAEFAMQHIEAFFQSQPTFAQVNELKTLIRHGPPFVQFMSEAMKRFVRTPEDYIRLVEFDEAAPSAKYRERMADFVAKSFEEFQKLNPSDEQLQAVASKLPKPAHDYPSSVDSCTDIFY